MRVVIDGLPEDIAPGSTVLDVLRKRGEPTSHIIIEVNGSFVHPAAYSTTKLREDDRLEIVYPAFGG